MGDPRITESEVRIYQIKGLAQELSSVMLDECLMPLLVVPKLIHVARFHYRKNMNQPGMVITFLEDLLNPVIYAECLRFTINSVSKP